MSATNSHTYDLIEEYLSGSLSEEQTDMLWAELLSDGDAMDYLQTMSAMKKLAGNGEFTVENPLSEIDFDYDKSAFETPDSESDKLAGSITYGNGGFTWKWIAAALVMIMAAAGISYMVLQESTNGQTGPIAMIEYDIFRSAGDELALMPSLDDVIMLSASGEHEQALGVLGEIRAESGLENDPQLAILEGSLHFNAGEFEMALSVFSSIDRSVLSSREYEEVLWYKANANVHAGQTLEATNTLQQIIQMDGSYSRVAKNLLNNLGS
ncbi:MAG: hypothetical protein LAT84_02890 [Balneolia bacterium]|nr:hypothetical protein [Balneolia bacterium]